MQEKFWDTERWLTLLSVNRLFLVGKGFRQPLRLRAGKKPNGKVEKFKSFFTKAEKLRFSKNSKQIIAFTAAFIIAALCNIDYESHAMSGNRVTSTTTWNGPVTGIGVSVIICMVLVYRSFLAIQDTLVAKHYLASRVTTIFDMLPWGILAIMVIGFSSNGDNWAFKWGGQQSTFWYFLALLATVFLLQAYTVVRRIAERAMNNAVNTAQ